MTKLTWRGPEKKLQYKNMNRRYSPGSLSPLHGITPQLFLEFSVTLGTYTMTEKDRGVGGNIMFQIVPLTLFIFYLPARRAYKQITFQPAKHLKYRGGCVVPGLGSPGCAQGTNQVNSTSNLAIFIIYGGTGNQKWIRQVGILYGLNCSLTCLDTFEVRAVVPWPVCTMKDLVAVPAYDFFLFLPQKRTHRLICTYYSQICIMDRDGIIN